MKKIFSHTLLYALGPQLPKLVNLFLLPIITPFLTPVDYGVQGVVTAYIGGFTALKDLGLLTVIVSSFHRHNHRYTFIWNRIYGFLSAWSVLFSLLLLWVLWVILPEVAEKDFVLLGLLVCLPVAFFDTTILFGNRLFQLKEKPLYPVLISIFSSLAAIFTTFVLVRYYKLGYIGLFSGVFVAQLVAFLCYGFLFLRHRYLEINFRFNFKWLKPFLLISIPTIPHFYSSYLFDVADRMIFTLFKIPISEIGFYDLGYSFGQYTNILNSAIGITLSVKYLEYYSKGNLESEKKAKQLTMVFQGLMFFLGFMAALWIKEVYSVLIKNEELMPAYSITALIIMSYSGKVFYQAAVNKFIFHNETKSLWRITGIGAIVNIVLNLIMVPLWGIWGGVIATLLASQYINLAGFYLSSYKKHAMVNYHPLRWLGIYLVLVAAVYFCVDLPVMLKASFSLLVLLAAFFYRNKLKEAMALI